MDDETIHFYCLYGFAFLSVVSIYLFSGSAWLVPLFLTFWALLSLFRLFVLTTPFQGSDKKTLPNKILASLGLKKQERREDVLIRIFMNPYLIGFIFAGVAYLCLEFLTYKPLLQDHLAASFWGHAAAVNVQSGSIYLALQSIFFPFLCGLVFILFCSHASSGVQNSYAALGFSVVLLLLLATFAVEPEVGGLSSYMARVSIGGFWLASLPYCMGFLVISIPALMLYDGIRDCAVPFFSAALILLSMALIDMHFSAGGASQALILSGWMVAGLITGPLVYRSQGEYLAYRGLKENLDFRTKVEHS